MLIDYKEKQLTQKYQLMAQTIIPRPIAWIVTQNSQGVINIAPFSYFTGLSSEPPTVIVSIGHKSDGTPKDTLRNIRETKKCTICIVDEGHLNPMHYSSAPLSAEESEAEHFNIPVKSIEEDFPPIIEAVPSAFFCRLCQEITLEGSKTVPLVLEIQKQYIDDDCMTQEGEKFTISFKPVARVGKAYAFLGKEVAPPKIPG